MNTGFYDEPLAGATEMSRIEYERSTARYGREAVMSWVRANPEKLPALTAFKIWSEWKPSSTTGALVLFTAVFAGAFLRGSAFARACLAMILGDVMMIAATWSVEGRFVFSAIVPLYALAGVGSWLLLRFVADLNVELRARTGIGG
jgi:hypothetical protein